MDLQELVSILENLTDDCQRVFHAALKEIIYRQKGPAKLKPCAELDCIVKVGLLENIDGRYSIPEMAKKKIRKLYTYLVRKFDFTYYFDPDSGEEKRMPMGAEFVSVLDISENRMKLRVKFPDDEVTEMLDLFGTNRCSIQQ